MDDWLAQGEHSHGSTLTLDELWALAKAWYTKRLAPDFHGHSVGEAHTIFRELGYTSDFWYGDPTL